MLKMTSFDMMAGPARPSSTKRTVSGTRSQSSPVAIAYAISVRPRPIPAAPTAPYVVLCESVPKTSSPGRTSARSINT